MGDEIAWQIQLHFFIFLAFFLDEQAHAHDFDKIRHCSSVSQFCPKDLDLLVIHSCAASGLFGEYKIMRKKHFFFNFVWKNAPPVIKKLQK